MIRCYSELIKLNTFEERFAYLQLNGNVGSETFGFDRYFNQQFYSSSDWRSIRNRVIIRDNGCDLGIDGRELSSRLYIHHMNPILLKDIAERSTFLLNPEYLITTSKETHLAIHYGDLNLLPHVLMERSSGDTKLW